jgi:hypothetical protein
MNNVHLTLKNLLHNAYVDCTGACKLFILYQFKCFHIQFELF